MGLKGLRPWIVLQRHRVASYGEKRQLVYCGTFSTLTGKGKVAYYPINDAD